MCVGVLAAPAVVAVFAVLAVSAVLMELAPLSLLLVLCVIGERGVLFALGSLDVSVVVLCFVVLVSRLVGGIVAVVSLLCAGLFVCDALAVLLRVVRLQCLLALLAVPAILDCGACWLADLLTCFMFLGCCGRRACVPAACAVPCLISAVFDVLHGIVLL